MHSRALELLQALGLRPHPEGGHYVELFRSAHRVEVQERKVVRAAITTIYFMLAAGEFSRWHRVVSDEIWHYHEGDAIELLLLDDRGLRRLRLGHYDGHFHNYGNVAVRLPRACCERCSVRLAVKSEG